MGGSATISFVHVCAGKLSSNVCGVTHPLCSYLSCNEFILPFTQTYMPWVARQAISKIIGPGRVKSLKTGGEVFDVQAIVGVK